MLDDSLRWQRYVVLCDIFAGHCAVQMSRRVAPCADVMPVSDLRDRRQVEQVRELPYVRAPISIRLECCDVDLPSRVLEVQPTRVLITAPIHPCRRPEVGVRCTAVWESKTGLLQSTGYVESHRRVPPSWVLRLEGVIERILVEERYPDDSPGTLEVNGSRLPARVIDRSLHGAACLVPALVRLRRGQRARLSVGDHARGGTIARVHPLGNQLRVGIRLDDV